MGKFKKIKFGYFCWLMIIAVFPAAGWAGDSFQAKVIGVSDGDTVTVLREKETVKIRLANIDAPERGQAFGKQAKQFLSRMVFQKEVVILPLTKERYVRTVASIKVEGKEVSETLVRAGLAWVYTKYNTDPFLAEIQKKAQAGKMGLWADPNPVPPWEYRRNRK